jgi:hypothetical protein
MYGLGKRLNSFHFFLCRQFHTHTHTRTFTCVHPRMCIVHALLLVEWVLPILCCLLLAATSIDVGVIKNPWRCGLCKFRCSTRSEVLEHTWGVHGLKSQFKCGLCSYRSSSKASFDAHFGSKHPATGNVELIHVYFKVCDGVYKLKTASDSSQNVYGTFYVYWTSEVGRVYCLLSITQIWFRVVRGISFLKMFWKFILFRLHFTW